MGFRSGFERTVAAQLTASKIKWKFEDKSQVVPYILEGTYHPDFHLVDKGILIETKGLLDRESKRKMLAVKKQHPELDIRFVFMYPDKKVPHTKQTHAQWAERNGFLWAGERVPDEWLKS